MSHRLVLPAAVAAVAVAALVSVNPALSAVPSPHGAVCQISGSATISPGLTQTAKSQSVTLSGVKLTNCESGRTNAAGVPKVLTGTVTISPNPVTTTASCASGNLSLSGSIAWSNGTSSAVTVATTGVTANQAIKGSVTSSTNAALKPGDLVAGDVAFRPTTIAQNCVKVPVTAVTFTGSLGAGGPK